MKRKLILLVLAIGILSLTGCGKQIFIDHSNDYNLVALGDKELKDDTYYVKDGSKFYSVYKPKGNSEFMTSANAKTLFWVDEDYSLIPTYYKNELIAYQSKSTTLTGIKLMRFNPIGYSLGIYKAYIDDDGYIAFSVKGNTIAGTSLNEIFNSAISDNIRIVSIDGVPVNESMLTKGGVIRNMKKNQSYEIGFYAGTHYGTTNVIADRYFLEGFEEYNIDKAIPTKNGYLSIQMPEDAKSGYYMINKAGFFIYKAHAKEEIVENEDMGVPYYTEQEEEYAENYTQYIATVQNTTNNVRFEVTYQVEEELEPDLSFILLSPTGMAYDIVPADGKAVLDLSDVAAGRWTINISPKDVVIEDILISNITEESSPVTEEKTFKLKEDAYDTVFTVSYEGEGEVWGFVTKKDTGEAVTLTLDEKSKKLTAEYPYLTAGNYIVSVYHYPDTAIKSIKKKENQTEYDNEIITVVE